MGIRKPAWLEALLVEKFFVGCSIHETAKKNEKNICCLDCCISMCPHCVMYHKYHRLLQVRRYVYHDVIRLEDLEKVIDCSNVQAYTINSAKVVFLKKRPQNRQFKGTGNFCTSCDRGLQEPFIHCSLGCKVDFVLNHYRDLSPFLRTCKTLQLSADFFIPQNYDDEEMTNDTTPLSTIVDYSDHDQIMCSNTTTATATTTSSGSSGSTENNMSFICTDFVRKKRSGLYVCGRSSSSDHDQNNKINGEEDSANMISRRKGVPRRSPLC